MLEDTLEIFKSILVGTWHWGGKEVGEGEGCGFGKSVSTSVILYLYLFLFDSFAVELGNGLWLLL